jgi:hypothetical protein
MLRSHSKTHIVIPFKANALEGIFFFIEKRAGYYLPVKAVNTTRTKAEEVLLSI